DFRQLVEVLAGLRSLGAPLALAVFGGEFCLQLGEARALVGIRRGRRRHVEAQLHEGARGGGRELLAVEALGLRHRPAEIAEVAVVAPGVQQLRVDGDEGVLRVAGGLHLLRQHRELAVDARDELVGALGGGRRGGGGGGLTRRAAAQQQDQRAAGGAGGQSRHGHSLTYFTPDISRLSSGVSASITAPAITQYQKIDRNSAGSDSRWLRS